MRSRLFGGMVSVACLAANAPLAAQNQQNQTAPTGDSAHHIQGERDAPAPKLTFDGDTALLTVAIKPDKAAEFERILSRLQAALMKSSDPQRQKQAAAGR